jgi:hypothetical protein
VIQAAEELIPKDCALVVTLKKKEKSSVITLSKVLEFIDTGS